MIRKNRTLLAALAVMLSGAAALSPLAGCVQVIIPPEAVLEGTWVLDVPGIESDTDPFVSDIIIVFDQEGKITRMSYKLNDPITGNSLDVLVNDPNFIQTDSTVDGSNVTVNTTWFSVNNLVFSGTLNSTQDVITGTISYALQIGSVRISVPATAGATLTKS